MATLVKEQLLTKAEAFANRESVLVTSDKTLSEAAATAGLSVSLVDVLDAGSIAVLGWRKIKAGLIVSPEDMEANYIRRTDAEIRIENFVTQAGLWPALEHSPRHCRRPPRHHRAGAAMPLGCPLERASISKIFWRSGERGR